MGSRSSTENRPLRRLNPWRGLGGLPGEIWILFTATLINRAGTMALPFMVLFLVKGTGASAAEAGLAPTLYGAGSFLTAPFAGRLSDRFGSLRIMRASLLLSGTILFFFPLAGNLETILLLTFFWAVISEAFRPASLSITTDLVKPEQRKAAFAVGRLAVNLGMSVGPAVGGIIAAHSYHALFYIDGATSVIAALVLIFSSWKAPAHIAAHLDVGPGTGSDLPRNALHDRRLLLFLSGLVLAAFAFFQHQSAMPIYLVRNLGLSESTYGLVFTVNTGLIILLEVPLNLALAHWSHRRTLTVGTFLTGAGFGALIFASDFLTVALTVVIWTFGEMILLPGSAAYIAEIAPPKGRGTYMGFYQMSFGFSFAVGPWLGAFLLQLLGSSFLWPFVFLLGVLSSLLMSRIRF